MPETIKRKTTRKQANAFVRVKGSGIFPGQTKPGVRGRFWDFGKHFFPEHPLIFKYHAEWVERIEYGVWQACDRQFNVKPDDIPIHELIVTAPQTAKTTWTSQLIPLYALAINPNMRIVLQGEDIPVTQENLSVVKAVMEAHEDYIARFGDKVPNGTSEEVRRKWNINALYCADRTKLALREASVWAQGATKLPAGFHPDIVIIDDPHADPEGRRTVIENAWNTAENLHDRIAHGGFCISVANCWHPWDFQARARKLWVNLFTNPPIVMVADSGETNPDGSVKSAMPELLSDAFLTQKRDTTDPYRYSCRYKIDPTPASSRVFNPDGFQITDWEPRRCDWLGMILDPAGSHKGEGSKNALLVFGWLPNGSQIVFDCWLKRCSDEEMYDKAAFFAVKYRPRWFGIEQVNFVSHLENNLRQRFDEIAPLLDSLPIMEGLTHGGKRKTERIRAQLTDFNRFRCLFHKDIEYLVELRNQILSVTELSSDEDELDGADAWGYIPQLSKGRRPDIARTLAPVAQMTQGERELQEALEGVDDLGEPPLYSPTGEKLWMNRGGSFKMGV